MNQDKVKDWSICFEIIQESISIQKFKYIDSLTGWISSFIILYSKKIYMIEEETSVEHSA